MKTKLLPYRIEYNLSAACRCLSSYRRCMFDLNCFNKGIDSMNNRNFIIGLGSVAVFTNLFVLLAGNHLDASTAKIFASAGVSCLSAAFVFFVCSTKSDAETQLDSFSDCRERDAVYRYIDDSVRELGEDILACSRTCDRVADNCSTSTKCCTKK